jgi:RimJ/RimL family protein N-acetyltransferase
MAWKSDVYLRRADREDLDTVVEWIEDPDFHRFLYGDPARSPKQVREQIVGMLGRSAGQAVPAVIYLIIDSKEKGPIGLVALQSISWRNRSCSVDLYIGKKEFRTGVVAGFSMYRAFEYCFDELNLHRVGAYIYSFNSPSWRLVEKSGAVREVTMTEHVARDGKLYDMYGYGLLKSEFEQLRANMGDKMKGKTLAEMIETERAEAEAAEAAP